MDYFMIKSKSVFKISILSNLDSLLGEMQELAVADRMWTLYKRNLTLNVSIDLCLLGVGRLFHFHVHQIVQQNLTADCHFQFSYTLFLYIFFQPKHCFRGLDPFPSPCMIAVNRERKGLSI